MRQEPKTIVIRTTVDDLLNYISTTEAPFIRVIWPKALLAATSVASMWMYVTPSMAAGEREHGEIGKWLQLVGNTSCAALVVFNIGGHYIGLLESSRDTLRFLKTQAAGFEKNQPANPNWVKNFFKKLKDNQLHILILAGLTATPLMAAAAAYPDWDAESETLLGAKMAVTFSVYTLIHTLPISLILNVDWLNFLLVKVPKFIITLPIKLPVAIGKAAYHLCCAKSNNPALVITERELQQQLKQNAALQAHIANTLWALTDQLKTHGFTKKGYCSYTPLPITDEENGIASTNLILSAAEVITANKSLLSHTDTTSQTSWLKQCGSYLYSGVRNVFGAAGSALVGASLFGYLSANWELFLEWTGGSTLGTIALLGCPAIVSEVLVMYYGHRAFSLAFDFVSNLITGKGQMPYPFKLNFGLSTAFLSSTYFLNAFAYGTALQLTHDTCDPSIYGRIGCDALEFASKWGLITYGCINMAELVEKLVEPVALRYGSKEQKEFVKILNELKRLAALITQLAPKECKQMLDSIENPKLLDVLGLVKNPDGTVQARSTVNPEPTAKPPESTTTKEPAGPSFGEQCRKLFCFGYGATTPPAPNASYQSLSS